MILPTGSALPACLDQTEMNLGHTVTFDIDEMAAIHIRSSAAHQRCLHLCDEPFASCKMLAHMNMAC